MLWLMRRFVVDMDIRPLYIWQRLKLHLQLLRNIMRGTQRFTRLHHNINLNQQSRPRRISPDGINRCDHRRMRHRDIRDQLLHLGIRSYPDEQLELVVCCVQPQASDETGQDDSAHWVDPPAELAAADRGEDTEAVDDEVVAVVFPKDAAKDKGSKIGRAYATFLDTGTIEAKGLAPIRPWLGKIAALKDRAGYPALLAEADRAGQQGDRGGSRAGGRFEQRTGFGQGSGTDQRRHGDHRVRPHRRRHPLYLWPLNAAPSFFKFLVVAGAAGPIATRANPAGPGPAHYAAAPARRGGSAGDARARAERELLRRLQTLAKQTTAAEGP